MAQIPEKNCRACTHSYMEPSDPDLICGHTDAGMFGLSLSRRQPAPHCGNFTKFVQHPSRNADGTLKKR
jgi:hypothetical protein